MKIILNRSNSRQRKFNISYFNRKFIDELIKKFGINDNELWNSYFSKLKGIDEFYESIHIRDMIDMHSDVNTDIINNWRYNQKLINYIFERNKNNENKLFDGINGKYDDMEIIDVDDEQVEYGRIDFGCFGTEYFRESINNEQIISELKKMIDDKYTKDDIDYYVKNNKLYKYTIKFLENPNIEELCPDEY